MGTGSGYGAALAARRLSNEQVMSVDVDPYLVEAARSRLAEAGAEPTVETVDATGDLPFTPSTFDRIVATVAVRSVPASWLTVLRPGGRLVTTLAGTSLLITAEKNQDGSAAGRVEWDRAGFMHARAGDDYPPGVGDVLAEAVEQDGDEVALGPYPIVDVANAWDLDSMLSLKAPGIEHSYEDDGEQRVALMAHEDGSWARATATGDDRPTVHQGGPRRLW
ncbi:methyltransferase domain-containing protein, partial [Streptomyces sp. 2MCAF27]